MANLYAVILVIHLICAVSLIILIMVQPSEAGGFLGTGSMSNLMAPRRTADVMTRLTTIMAGCFFATSLFLAISANHHPAAKSILDVDAGAPAKQGAAVPAVTGKDATPDAGKDAAAKDKGADAASDKTGDKATDKKAADQDATDDDADDQKAQDKKAGGKKDGDKTGVPKAPQTE